MKLVVFLYSNVCDIYKQLLLISLLVVLGILTLRKNIKEEV